MTIKRGIRGQLIPLKDRFWSKVTKGDGCWEWMAARTSTGYGIVRGDAPRGEAANLRAHRVAWMLTWGVMPERSLDVCHTCDNRLCVRPEHLFVGSRADNMRDCAEKDRTCRGERRPNSKLTDGDVRRIRSLAASGAPPRDLAGMFGVSDSCIRLVATRKRWRHVA